MKKAKISDSEIRLIILLVSILMLAGAYFLGFSRFTAAAEELEKQNDVDQATVKTLEDMERRRTQVEQETESLRQEIADIVSKYPSDLTTEKVVTIIQNLVDYSEVEIPNISFSMNNLLMRFDMSEVAGSNGSTTPTGYYSTVDMTYTATYDNLKRMVEYVNAAADRTTVPDISATYDVSTDMISGMVSLKMYYLMNTDKEYEAPSGNGGPKGVDSIFGGGAGVGAPAVNEAEDETVE